MDHVIQEIPCRKTRRFEPCSSRLTFVFFLLAPSYWQCRRQTERNLFFAFLACHLFAGPSISILIPTPLNAQKHIIWFSEHPQQLSEHPSPPYAACPRQLIHPLSLKTALPVNRPLPESTLLEKHSSGTCTTRS